MGVGQKPYLSLNFMDNIEDPTLVFLILYNRYYVVSALLKKSYIFWNVLCQIILNIL